MNIQKRILMIYSTGASQRARMIKQLLGERSLSRVHMRENPDRFFHDSETKVILPSAILATRAKENTRYPFSSSNLRPG